MRNKKIITSNKKIKLLFYICWLAYFSTYIGRLNFSASINEIIYAQGYSKTQMGTVVTMFFISYGIGQLINGFLGDRIPSKKMVFIGLFSTATLNLLMGISNSYRTMALLWMLNGIFQSMIWSPILQLISERLDAEKSTKVCVNLSSTVPAGTLITYFLCSQIIKYLSWRWVFIAAFGIILVVAILWWLTVTHLEQYAQEYGKEKILTVKAGEETRPVAIKSYRNLIISMVLIAFSAMLHGILKDSIQTWIPTYLSETYQKSVSSSIQLSMVLPVINLFGVYTSDFLNKKVFHNELLTAAVFFGISVCAIIPNLALARIPIAVSLILLGIITSSMLGVNTMLVSMVPIQFRRFNKVASICGILNSATYVGSAISGYGTGAITQEYGWTITIFVWTALALTGCIVCSICIGLWRKIKLNTQ